MFRAFMRRLLIFSISAVSYVSLAACVVTDTFKDRASQYNEQTADTKRSGVITNIVRSAYTLPLQFTDISTITGQAQAQGSISSLVPYSLLNAVSLSGNVGPGGNISANSTFGVTNLNTQEFYQGLQEPISKDLLGFYLKSGFPPEIILPLLISEIEVVHNNRRIRFANDPLKPLAHKKFNDTIQILLAKGFSVSVSQSSEKYGPVINAAKASDSGLLAQMMASAAGSPVLKAVEGGYQIQKASKSAIFCFDPLKFQGPGKYDEYGVSSGKASFASESLVVPLATASGLNYADATFKVSAANFCGNIRSERNSAPGNKIGKEEVTPDFSVTLRSVEGVFTYLGEIVRTELGLSGEAIRLDLESFDGNLYRIFRLEQRAPGIGEIGISYLGVPYALKIDPSGQDASSRVLQLLTDLLALKSSAKNLPSPSVVSIIGR